MSSQPNPAAGPAEDPPASRRIVFRILRGEWEDYPVPVSPGDTVMDILERLKRDRVPDLLYRHSCHHGSCGTCGCRINGRERLACTANVWEMETEVVTLEPLRGHRIIGDLAVDPADLFRDLPSHSAYLREIEKYPGYLRFEDCIECGCCVSACPVLSPEKKRPFLGPAALAAWSRERINHPGTNAEALEKAALPEGTAACDRAFECSRVCPTGVAPGKHIQLLRREVEKSRETGKANPGA